MPVSSLHFHLFTAHRKTQRWLFSAELSWVPVYQSMCLLDVCVGILHQNIQSHLHLSFQTGFCSDRSASAHGPNIHPGPKFKHPEPSLPPLAPFLGYRDALLSTFLSFTATLPSPWFIPSHTFSSVGQWHPPRPPHSLSDYSNWLR